MFLALKWILLDNAFDKRLMTQNYTVRNRGFLATEVLLTTRIYSIGAVGGGSDDEAVPILQQAQADEEMARRLQREMQQQEQTVSDQQLAQRLQVPSAS